MPAMLAANNARIRHEEKGELKLFVTLQRESVR